MAEPSPLAPLEAAVSALLAWLSACAVPGLVIGGVAASLLGRPRATRDVDAMVWLLDPAAWPAFLTAAGRHGIVARIDDPLAFALQARVLLLTHAPSGIDLDVSLGALPFEEEAIARGVVARLGRIEVPLPTPEDLIVMKAVAHRPRDAADIEAVVAAHPGLDAARVRAQVAAFAEALDMPELLRDLEVGLGQGRPGTPARPARGKKPGPRR